MYEWTEHESESEVSCNARSRKARPWQEPLARGFASLHAQYLVGKGSTYFRYISPLCRGNVELAKCLNYLIRTKSLIILYTLT